jgi:hypothetical protein
MVFPVLVKALPGSSSADSCSSSSMGNKYPFQNVEGRPRHHLYLHQTHFDPLSKPHSSIQWLYFDQSPKGAKLLLSCGHILGTYTVLNGDRSSCCFIVLSVSTCIRYSRSASGDVIFGLVPVKASNGEMRSGRLEVGMRWCR